MEVPTGLYLLYLSCLSSNCLTFFYVTLMCIETAIGTNRLQWRSHWGGKGCRVPPLTAKILPKFGKKREKNREKIRKNREKRGKNREEKAKIGKVLSHCPSWQIGLATLLPTAVFIHIGLMRSTVPQVVCHGIGWFYGLCLLLIEGLSSFFVYLCFHCISDKKKWITFDWKTNLDFVENILLIYGNNEVCRLNQTI